MPLSEWLFNFCYYLVHKKSGLGNEETGPRKDTSKILTSWIKNYLQQDLYEDGIYNKETVYRKRIRGNQLITEGIIKLYHTKP